MAFYILLFVFTVGILFCSRKKSATRLSIGILWAVYAFRDDIGVDDGNYIQVIDYLKRGWGYDVEWSYRKICELALKIGMNYKFCFFVYGTLSIILLYKALDIFFEGNFKKGIYLACFYGTVFVSSVTVMRQFLAACFCFYAIALLYRDNKLTKPLIMCVLGVVFHSGAILAIPFLFILQRNYVVSYTKKIIIIFLCVACGYLGVLNILINIFMRFIPGSYQMYASSLGQSYSTAGGTLSWLLLLMFAFQCVASERAGIKVPEDKLDNVMEMGQLMYLGLLFLFVRAGVASRLAFTFLPFVATVPITFIKRIRKVQRKVVIFVLVVAMLLLMCMTLNSTAAIRNGVFIPYRGSFNFWK